MSTKDRFSEKKLDEDEFDMIIVTLGMSALAVVVVSLIVSVILFTVKGRELAK